MITVVHVITKLELGGAQENTLYTSEHLERSRFRVVLMHGPGGILDPDAARLPDTQVEVVQNLVRQVDPRQDSACFGDLALRFETLMREHERAGGEPGGFVVHTHSSKAGIVGRLAAKAAGVPIVVHSIHGFGFHERQHPLKRMVFVNAERAAGRATHAFIGVSSANLAEGRALGIIRPEHHTELIRSGMPLSPYAKSDERRQSAREALGLDDDFEMVLAIGNFKPQKDPVTLVRAMARLRELRPSAHLYYAGDGGLRPEVERTIAELGLADHVTLLGWRRDIPELLAACDVVALSSIFEGLPRSAVQAVASRRPFVGTRVDGTPEIIRDGKNGYLVEPRNPEALAKALARALLVRPVDPEDDERILDWDADRMVRAQEALYIRMVTRRR